MKKILDFLGYDKSLDIKERFTYAISFISLGLVSLFFIFYLLVIKNPVVNFVTLLCFLDLLSVFVFLKRRNFYLAKFLLLFGFMFQEFSLVFLWFPRDANFNYFFFVITPITFFIFDIEKKPDRIYLIISNSAAIILLLLSEILPQKTVFIDLQDNIKTLFSILSIFSTIVSIFIVYFFYANTLKTILKELNFLANTDHLTQTYNRRTLFTEGQTLFDLSRKYSRTFTFLLFDLDHFKSVNDRYGHLAGDLILKQVSELIKSIIRKNDLFSRYGGEEFAIIFQDTSTESAIKTAHKLRRAVEDHPFTIPDEISPKVTISIGVSFRTDQHHTFDELVQAADKALYEAKELGRNRVVIAG